MKRLYMLHMGIFLHELIHHSGELFVEMLRYQGIIVDIVEQEIGMLNSHQPD